MKSTTSLKNLCSLLIFTLQMILRVSAGSQFASHVSVNTPSLSFTHGVGDPISTIERRTIKRIPQRASTRRLRQPPFAPHLGSGYPRIKPSVPFNEEDIINGNSLNGNPWQYNNVDLPIAVLPPSPYKVNSPDPESLWPEGLFVPPMRPTRFGIHGRRADTGEVSSDSDPLDPYLLEGSEAVAAVHKASLHGLLYFHDVPHIDSLFANQQKRIRNKLTPHRIASIRHTWPYNRP